MSESESAVVEPKEKEQEAAAGKAPEGDKQAAPPPHDPETCPGCKARRESIPLRAARAAYAATAETFMRTVIGAVPREAVAGIEPEELERFIKSVVLPSFDDLADDAQQAWKRAASAALKIGLGIPDEKLGERKAYTLTGEVPVVGIVMIPGTEGRGPVVAAACDFGGAERGGDQAIIVVPLGSAADRNLLVSIAEQGAAIPFSLTVAI